ncbi:diaminopimelate decarboxylase [Plantactinospora solaniradicis]|uniref:Diaminopimelate decarboxylase n=1 Tax=Plantactinospora solaniradicis TaxID=1723736 RepID=A0ABW1KTY4_9ACTN
MGSDSARSHPDHVEHPSGVRVWPRNVHRGPEGGLKVGALSLDRIADQFGTPAFVLDEAEFRGRCREFRDAFPEAKVYYAGKAFLCRAVAAMAHQEGLGVDVCSGGELTVALSAGVPPETITMHGNNKSLEELERATALGVGTIVVDSFEEVARLTAIARRRGVRPGVMVRVMPGVEAHTHELVATAHDDQKFGLSLRDGSAEAAISGIISDGVLQMRGLHCHVGSQIFDSSAHELAATRVLALYARFGMPDGGPWPELNLGGGFGISYTTAEEPVSLCDFAAALEKVIGQECATLRIPHPQLVIEPGRAIVGPSMLTLYRVGTVKPRPGLRTYVSVDGGMSDNIRTALYDATYTATIANRTSTVAPVPTRVVGRHCESGDIVVREARLPGDVRSGDLLAVAATGAYCRGMASNYNHTPRPPVLAVNHQGVRAVVRRETDADLMNLDVGP